MWLFDIYNLFTVLHNCDVIKKNQLYLWWLFDFIHPCLWWQKWQTHNPTLRSSKASSKVKLSFYKTLLDSNLLYQVAPFKQMDLLHQSLLGMWMCSVLLITKDINSESLQGFGQDSNPQPHTIHVQKLSRKGALQSSL